jgi:hypothetical protein
MWLIGASAAFVVVILLGTLGRHDRDGSKQGASPWPISHRVKYVVDGSAISEIDLTYANESGGTEQQTVQIVPSPWEYEMGCQHGCFAYISAQKTETLGSIDVPTGTVRVAIYVDGRLVREAESTSRYGIASASGRVP